MAFGGGALLVGLSLLQHFPGAYNLRVTSSQAAQASQTRQEK